MCVEKWTDIPAKNKRVGRKEGLTRVDGCRRVMENSLELSAKQRVCYFGFWLKRLQNGENAMSWWIVSSFKTISLKELTAAFAGFKGAGANSDDLACLEEGPWLYCLAWISLNTKHAGQCFRPLDILAACPKLLTALTPNPEAMYIHAWQFLSWFARPPSSACCMRWIGL